MISIISFILDNLISNFINHNSLFYPLFTMLSLIIIYPKFNKKDNKYYICSFILGLIYDITVSDTLFLNAFIFLLLLHISSFVKYLVSSHVFCPFSPSLLGHLSFSY